MAYVLVSGLRRLGLKAAGLATAQAAAIREKLFKIGARVTVSVRRVWLSRASAVLIATMAGGGCRPRL
jgi:hypothetical protein